MRFLAPLDRGIGPDLKIAGRLQTQIDLMEQLKKIATRKLEYVLDKQRKNDLP